MSLRNFYFHGLLSILEINSHHEQSWYKHAPFPMKIEDIRKYESLPLIAKSLIEGFLTGLHQSPYHGFSVEYSEHRMYNYGESTRHIDWKAYAKTEKLYVKKYEEETNLRAYLVVDTSSSMYYPLPDCDKMRFAVYAAAALAYLFHKQRDAVGLFTFSNTLQHNLNAQANALHLQSVFHHLHTLLQKPAVTQSTQLPEILETIAVQIPKRSMVVLLVDLFQDPGSLPKLWKALSYLIHCKHEVLLFHINDQATEKNLAFDHAPYLLQDIEGKGKIKVNPKEIAALYATNMKDYYKDLENKCGNLGVSFLPVDTHETFDKIFLSCLMRRAKMH